jgi:hypothetical protein
MKKLVVLTGVIAVISLVLSAVSGIDPPALLSNRPTNPREQAILGATVQIVLIAQPDGTLHAAAERGLGTLALNPGGALLITHDHWGGLLDSAPMVQVRDTEDALLLELSGREFRNAILYRDGGTMVLRAPAGLLPSGQLAGRAASLGDRQEVQPGDTVHLVHQLAGKEHQIGVMDAVIESVSGKDQRPVYTLRSLDGTAIIPGDSGGGIWVEGELLGNMWTTIMIRETVTATGEEHDVPTDTCVAAIHLQTVHSLGTAAEPLPEANVTQVATVRAQ